MAIQTSTKVARELFLYGGPDGRRVTKVQELIRLSGAGRRTITEHLPGWRRESEEMALRRSVPGGVLALSVEALDAHKSDIAILRSEIDRVSAYLQGLETDSCDYAQTAKLLTTLQARWSKASGVDGAISAAEARLKETARAEVRQAAREAAAEAERAAGRGAMGSAGGPSPDVFGKSGAVDSPVVDVVEDFEGLD